MAAISPRQSALISAASRLPAYSGWSQEDISSNMSEVLASGDSARISRLSGALAGLNEYSGWQPAEISGNLTEVFQIKPSTVHTMPSGETMAGPEHPGAVPGSTRPWTPVIDPDTGRAAVGDIQVPEQPVSYRPTKRIVFEEPLEGPPAPPSQQPTRIGLNVSVPGAGPLHKTEEERYVMEPTEVRPLKFGVPEVGKAAAYGAKTYLSDVARKRGIGMQAVQYVPEEQLDEPQKELLDAGRAAAKKMADNDMPVSKLSSDEQLAYRYVRQRENAEKIRKAGKNLSGWANDVDEAFPSLKQAAEDAQTIVMSKETWDAEKFKDPRHAMTVLGGLIGVAAEQAPNTAVAATALVPGVGPVISTMGMVDREAGAWIKQAQQYGIDDPQILDEFSTIYAVPSGLVEVGSTAMILAPGKVVKAILPGTAKQALGAAAKKLVVGKLAAKIAGNRFAQIAGSAVLEGAEEMTQNQIQALVTRAALEESAKRHPEKAEEYRRRISDIDMNFFSDDAIAQGIIGAITGGFLGGGRVAYEGAIGAGKKVIETKRQRQQQAKEVRGQVVEELSGGRQAPKVITSDQLFAAPQTDAPRTVTIEGEQKPATQFRVVDETGKDIGSLDEVAARTAAPPSGETVTQPGPPAPVAASPEAIRAKYGDTVPTRKQVMADFGVGNREEAGRLIRDAYKAPEGPAEAPQAPTTEGVPTPPQAPAPTPAAPGAQPERNLASFGIKTPSGYWALSESRRDELFPQLPAAEQEAVTRVAPTQYRPAAPETPETPTEAPKQAISDAVRQRMSQYLESQGVPTEDTQARIAEIEQGMSPEHVAILESFASDADLAYKDPLIGIWNRRWRDENVEGKKTVRVDIDKFKNVNDTYGHKVGDQVLQRVGQILTDNLRGKGEISRYGGEEIDILYDPNVPDSDILRSIGAARRQFYDTPFADGKLTGLTFSAGVGTELGDIGGEQADGQLYKAKENGRAQTWIGDNRYGKDEVRETQRREQELRPGDTGGAVAAGEQAQEAAAPAQEVTTFEEADRAFSEVTPETLLSGKSREETEAAVNRLFGSITEERFDELYQGAEFKSPVEEALFNISEKYQADLDYAAKTRDEGETRQLYDAAKREYEEQKKTLQVQPAPKRPVRAKGAPAETTPTTEQTKTKREGQQVEKYAETGKPTTQLTERIHDELQDVLRAISPADINAILKSKYPEKRLRAAIIAIQKGNKDGKPAVEIRQEVGDLLRSGMTPDDVIEIIQREAMRRGKEEGGIGFGVSPEGVPLTETGEPMFQRITQREMFGDEELTPKQAEDRERQRMERAEIRRRTEATRGGEAPIGELPLFEGAEIEGAQMPLFQRAPQIDTPQLRREQQEEGREQAGRRPIREEPGPAPEHLEPVTGAERKGRYSFQLDGNFQLAQDRDLVTEETVLDMLARAYNLDRSDVRGVVVSPVGQVAEQAKILEEMSDREIVWLSFDEDTENKVDFYGVEYKGKIYLNINNPHPYLATGFHEVWESYMRDHPDLVNPLVDFAIENATESGQNAARDYATTYETSERTAYKEKLFDFAADSMRDPAWWEKLYQKSPEAFRALVRKVWDYLNRYLRRMSGAGFAKSDMYRDAESVRDRIREVFKKVQQRRFDRKQAREMADIVQAGAPSIEEHAQSQRRQPADTFFSPTLRATENLKMERGTGDQIFAMITKSPGVKEAEWKWMGLDDFLKGKKSVTKQEVLDFVRQNQVVVEEKTLGGLDRIGRIEESVNAAREFLARRNALDDDVDAAFDEYLDSEGFSVEAQRTINNALDENNSDYSIKEWEPTAEANLQRAETQYSQYVLPGGENYREVLFKMPAEETAERKLPLENKAKYDRIVAEMDEMNREAQERGAAVEGRYYDLADQLTALTVPVGSSARGTYIAPHFEGGEGKNLIAHARLNDRTGPNGEKVLFIEELQADLTREIRDLEAKIASGKATDAERARLEQLRAISPFSGNWLPLVLKRILRMAAEGGYDRVAWTTGAQQQDRYNLAKQIDAINWIKEPNRVMITAFKNRENVFEKNDIAPNELAGVIGKDAAQKILDSEESGGTLEGVDLEIGGEWAVSLYDRMIPQYLNKYAKKWGANVEHVSLETGGKNTFINRNEAHPQQWEVHGEGGLVSRHATREEAAAEKERIDSGTVQQRQQSIPVTDAMRESVMYEGQPMFQRVPKEGAQQEQERLDKSVPELDRPEDVPTAVPAETKRDWFQRKVQDKMNRLKKIQEALAPELPENVDTYLQAELIHGKTEYRLNEFDNNQVKPLITEINKSGLPLEKIEEYLYAKHAKERNAHIRDIRPDFDAPGSGMADYEADAILAKAKEEGLDKELEKIANMVYEINDASIEARQEAGLIDQPMADAWRQYDYYVPLKGIQEEIPQRMRTGRGFDIRGKESKRALGRKSKASNIIANSILQTNEAIVRAEKNKVGQTFLRFVEAHPNAELWEVDKVEKKPYFDENKGEVVLRVDPRFRLADNVLSVKVDGEEHLITIKDEGLARAMKNLGADKSNAVLQTLAAFNRYMAMINTSLVPEFALSNFSRDVQTAMINIAGMDMSTKDAVKTAGAILKNTPAAMKGVWQGSKGKSNEWADYYREFAKEGGKIGFFGMKDVVQQQKEIVNALALMRPGAKATTIKMFKEAKDFVMDVNEAVENATRLSTYVAMRKRGMSKAKAASVAKNITVNFNKKGELGAVMNALYVFSNAGVQGTARLFKALKSPRVQKIVTGIALGSVAMAQLNRSLAGDDDDDENYYDKVPDWVKENNIVIMFPGTKGKYMKIPVPYGYNVFWALGQSIDHAIHHPDESGKAAVGVAKSVANAFNPLGGELGPRPERIVQTFAPTFTRPVVDLAINENFFGAPIYKERDNAYGPPESASHQFFRSTSEVSKTVAQALNEMTGGTKYQPGAVDINPDVMDYMVEYVTGGAGRTINQAVDLAAKAYTQNPVAIREIPVVRRFVGEVDDYAAEQAFWDNVEKLEAIRADYDFLRETDQAKAARFFAKNQKKLKIDAKGFARGTGDIRKTIRNLEAKGKDTKRLEETLLERYKAFNKMAREAK